MAEMTRDSVLGVAAAKDSSTPTPTAKHRLPMFDRTLWAQALEGRGEAPSWFIFNVAIWPWWFTVLFANFAEALAEGRGKAQAASLRGLQQAVFAKKLGDPHDRSRQVRVKAPDLGKGTSCSSRPETTFRATAKSSGAQPLGCVGRNPNAALMSDRLF